jgi:hypothetical protein
VSDPAQIEDRFRMANPIPDPTNPPATVTPAAEVLLALEMRRRTMQTQATNPTTKPTKPRQRWKGPLLAAAAFVAVLVVGAIMLASRGDDPDDVANPATTPAPTSQAPAGFTVDDALAVATAHFDDFNAADIDAVLASLTADVTISGSILGAMTVAEWEMLTVWNLAQGTVLGSPDCTVTEETPGESVFVTCDSATKNAQIQAVGSPPVPTIVRMIVTPDGMTSLRFGYGHPNFNDANIPFQAWVQANHPADTESVSFGTWTSLEEAEQNGMLVAEYSTEWAAYLGANGCAYDDGC